MSDQNKDKEPKRGLGPVRTIILIIAVAVFCYSGYRLYTIFSGYKAASDEYHSLADEFTSPVSGAGAGADGAAATKENAAEDGAVSGEEAGDGQNAGQGQIAAGQAAAGQPAGSVSAVVSAQQSAAGAQSTDSRVTGSGAASAAADSGSTPDSAADKTTPEKPVIPSIPGARKAEEEDLLIEDAKPPLKVDWKQLKAINPDIVGWLYVDAQPNISYPILRGDDNDEYLHTTFRKQYLYAGSIFEETNNNGDFADPNTIVYGHNMKDGSMFGTLKNMNDQEKYDKDPYFWILTPDGNYRYHIYSIFTTGVDSDTYTLYSQNGPEFLQWEEKMQNQSDVKNTVKLSKSDKTVILSTCTSDSSKRCVVIGKCVSSKRPARRQAVGLTVVKAEDET